MTLNRLKQSRKVCFLSIGPTEPPTPTWSAIGGPLQIVHLTEARPIGLDEYIRSFKRFYPPIHRCSPNKPMTLMSATGRVSQTVEKLSSDRE
jgi:hypothetical protein